MLTANLLEEEALLTVLGAGVCVYLLATIVDVYEKPQGQSLRQGEGSDYWYTGVHIAG